MTIKVSWIFPVTPKIIRIRVKPIAIRSERGNRGQVGGSLRTKSRAPRLRGTFFSKLQLRSTRSFPVEPFPRATKPHSLLLVQPLPEFPISLTRMLTLAISRTRQRTGDDQVGAVIVVLSSFLLHVTRSPQFTNRTISVKWTTYFTIQRNFLNHFF